MAGIPIGMQNLLRIPTGGVAFAQPPATSLNPYRMKTDDVKAEQKSGFGRNIERRKMSLVSLCVRFLMVLISRIVQIAVCLGSYRSRIGKKMGARIYLLLFIFMPPSSCLNH